MMAMLEKIMPQTHAERQRAYKARQKLNEQRASLQLSDVYKRPFFEFYNERDQSELAIPLAWAGIPAPAFLDDRGPEHFVPEHAIEGLMGELFADATNSLGRAENMVGCLLDAAIAVAEKVNAYKRAEIKTRLAELEEADLSLPAAKKAALKEASRLNKMLDQLDKQVRWAFPAWKVTG